MKRNLLLLLMLLPLAASAYDAYIGGIYYNLSENEATVTYRNNNFYSGTRTIPKSIKYKNKPYSVTCIGDRAFWNCTGLKSISIPQSVTSIRDRAFGNCTSLKSISIPQSVTNIGYDAFSGCYFMTDSFINNTSLTSGNNWGATLCDEETSDGLMIKNNVVVKCRPRVTSVTIPSSVTSIGSSAFSGCSSLTSVTIPNSVTSIGGSAFSGCSSLTSITLDSDAIVSTSRSISTSLRFIFGEQVEEYVIGNSVNSIGSYAFSGCSSLTSVTIGNDVTSIGDYAFSGCSSLTSVTIGNNVTSIGSSAFSGCSGLTSITIPNSVTSIGVCAFLVCSSLTSVTIPSSVTFIGGEAFSGCSGLKSIVVEAGNTSYDSRNNSNAIIETATNTLIAGCQSTVISQSVTSIGNYAFMGCSGLTSVTIPKGVTSIGEYAFSGSRLTDVYCYADRVPSTDSNAFKSFFSDGIICPDICNAILRVPSGSVEQYKKTSPWSDFGTIIPFDNPHIGSIYYIFSENEASVTYQRYQDNHYISDCSGSIVIPEFVTYNGKTYRVTGIGDYAFYNCSGLTSVTIGNGVTSIGEGAFYGCSGLTSVNIGDDVTSIGSSAFSGCSSLTSIIIPNSVTSIGRFAFRDCSGLTSVTIGSGMTSIGEYAFNKCSGLTSVTIPNGVTSVGEYAFEGCSGLTSVTIGSGVTSIGEYAFSGCSGLTSVTIPNSVMSIGRSAFCDCNCLTSVTLESNAFVSHDRESYYGIYESMLYLFGDQVKEYVIGNAVTCIGAGAFNDCSGMSSVTIPNSVTSIGSSAFQGCRSLTSITIPNSVTSIGYEAFSGCSGLVSITIPHNVMSIRGSAFDGCNLRNVLIKCTTPPSIRESTFTDQVFNHAILYVPTECRNAYAYDDAWYKFINIRETDMTEEQVSMQQAYTLMDVSSFTYSVYDPVNESISAINSVGINEDNPNHSWQVIESGESHYLYNIGAKKFVKSTPNGSYTLSDTPTTIVMENGENGIILGTQTEKQWALVSNESMSVNQSVITGISLTPALSKGEEVIYNVSGQRLNKMQKGINIVGSKKVLAK